MQKVDLKSHLFHQRGSILLSLVLSAVVLLGIFAISYSYLTSTNKIIKEVNRDIDLENMRYTLLTYFSEEGVCSAHFKGKNLLNDVNSNIFYTNKTGSVFAVDPKRPFTPISAVASEFHINKTLIDNANSLIIADLNFVMDSKSSVYPVKGFIQLQIELDDNVRITKCRSNFDNPMPQSNCTPGNRGAIIIDEYRMARVCNGKKWIPASRSGGYFTYTTLKDGGVESCLTGNLFSGGCHCPPDYKPELVVDFESRNCEWKYYKNSKHSGCGRKTMECIYE